MGGKSAMNIFNQYHGATQLYGKWFCPLRADTLLWPYVLPIRGRHMGGNVKFPISTKQHFLTTLHIVSILKIFKRPLYVLITNSDLTVLTYILLIPLLISSKGLANILHRHSSLNARFWWPKINHISPQHLWCQLLK